MDPITLSILLASGGLIAFSARRPEQVTPAPGEFDWPRFLESELARELTSEQTVAFDYMQEHGLPVPAEALSSPQDVLRLFGALNEKQLSRRIYRNTECGAWAKFIKPGRIQIPARGRYHVYDAVLRIEGDTVRLDSLKAVDVWHELVDKLDSLPAETKTYLLLGSFDGDPRRLEVTPEEIRSMSADGDTTLRVEQSQQGALVRFRVWINEYRIHRGGLMIGSIVEGSDAVVMPEELYYPFTEQDLERAIENVEEEADFLWREANEEWDEDDEWPED